MKVTLDLGELVSRGELTAAEAERLKALASRDTGALGVNIILSFGVIAVAAGAGILVPTAYTAIVLGAILMAGGMTLTLTRSETWTLLAQICATVGTLLLAGGLLYISDGSPAVLLAVTLGIAGAAVLTRSGLLSALAVIGLASTLGSETGYSHALYRIAVPEPGINVAVFSLVALGLFIASLRLPHAYERLAIIGARTAVLMVNLAFLVGSLWGDSRLQLPDVAFTAAWALLLLAVGAWAVSINRRWLVNTTAVFGGLHFYTQWFELLGANPLTILAGGVLLVVFGMALWSFNRNRKRPDARPPAAALPA